ncbi:hypothetical protein CDL12_29724 [Handroanthus impetiginosus]|uniref:Uncharacterized protein n=1 Tax=Handroanthus impetiginosus TaxID=429701 RepID=A0A2G9FXL8_9LAMI|nr:hypothetical protein CDL12_29724 [Handroanthus impetiginosus]
MIHTNSESDLTSMSSPKAYYVQSPSRDSNDETDKCSSTNGRCPSDSPLYSRPSAASSSSTAACSRVSGNRRRWNKHYCNVVAEEKGTAAYIDGDDDYDYGDRGYNSMLCKWLAVVVGFGMCFGGICLLVWGTSLPYKAQVNIKSLMVHNLYFGEGSDHTGVPTKLLTVNCSASLAIYNPARFFGIHVSSPSANLIFSEITVATGQMKKYYQPKRSKRTVLVRVMGRGVPLYGAGTALAAADASGGGIPLKFEFEVQTRGYLVGKLVQTKHRTRASCPLLINSKRTKQIIFEHDSCQYGL